MNVLVAWPIHSIVIEKEPMPSPLAADAILPSWQRTVDLVIVTS